MSLTYQNGGYIDLLIKKYLGVVESSTNTTFAQEAAGSARPKIISNSQIYSQYVPPIAPSGDESLNTPKTTITNTVTSPTLPDLVLFGYVKTDGTIDKTTDGGNGVVYTSITYPHIQFIQNLKLSAVTDGFCYRFANPATATNILSNLIPFNFDPIKNSYTTYLYTSSGTYKGSSAVNQKDYIIDTDAGYLYFIGNDWTNGNPLISFYRYNGKMGIPTNLGNFAGAYAQDPTAIAIGNNAGYTGQGANALAIGNYAGAYGQGTGSIAIGTYAGYTGMKQYSIAIGAFAGPTGMSANSIVLNASGTGLAGTGPTGGFYVAPIASYSGSTGPFMLLAYGADKQIVCVTGAALTAMNIGGGGGADGVITGTTGSFTSLSATTIATSSITGTTGSFTSLSAISSIAFVDESVSLFPSWRLSREVGSSRLVFRDSSSVIQLALSNYVSVPVSLRLPYLTAHATYQKCLIIAANSANLDVTATDAPNFTAVTAVTFQTTQTGLIETNTIRSTAGQLTSTLVLNAYDIGGPGSYSSIGLRLNNVSKLSIVDAGIEAFVTLQCPTLRTVYGLYEGLSNAGQIRMTYGNYGVMMRNDGGSFYFLLTNSGDPYGGWNGLRPFYIDLASGNLYSNNAQRFTTVGNAVCATSIMHGTTICPNNPSNWDLYGLFVGADGSLPGPAAFNSQSPGFGIGYDRQYNPGHVRLIALEPAIQWKEMHYGAHIHVFWTFGYQLCGYVNSGGFVSLSDGRAKRDVRPIKTTRSLERILRARPVTYHRIVPDDDKMIPDSERLCNHIGLIAQDVREFNPHAVDDSASNEKQEYLGIRYNDFVIHLIGAVQELHKKLALTEEKLALTEEKLVSTEEKLALTDAKLASTDTKFALTDAILDSTEEKLALTEEKLVSTYAKLVSTEEKLALTDAKLALTEEKLASTDAKLALTDAKLVSTEEKLASTDAKLASLQLSALEARLAAQERVNELQQEQINRLVAALPNAFNVIV